MSTTETHAREDWREADDRFDRQRRILGWDQNRLAAAHVLVAGAGAIGNEALKLLALLGVGRVTVIDMDRVEASNLSRTVLFRDHDVGRPKAEVAAARALEMAPGLRIEALVGDVEHDLGLGRVREADAILGCLDNLHARVALNRAARRAGVPWVNAAIDARALEVAAYLPEGACFECGLGDRARARWRRRYSCGTGLVLAASAGKVATVATVASIAAALQVEAALALLRGDAGDAAARRGAAPLLGLRPGERLYLSLETLAVSRARLAPVEGCLAHERWPAPRPVPLGPEASLAEVADWLERHGEPRIEALDLGSDLVTALRCEPCGRSEPVFRPRTRVRAEEARCPDCGEHRRVEATSLIDRASALARAPLRRIGVPERAVLKLAASGESTCFAELRGASSAALG